MPTVFSPRMRCPVRRRAMRRCRRSDRVEGAKPSRRAAVTCGIHWQYFSSKYSKR